MIMLTFVKRYISPALWMILIFFGKLHWNFFLIISRIYIPDQIIQKYILKCEIMYIKKRSSCKKCGHNTLWKIHTFDRSMTYSIYRCNNVKKRKRRSWRYVDFHMLINWPLAVTIILGGYDVIFTASILKKNFWNIYFFQSFNISVRNYTLPLVAILLR